MQSLRIGSRRAYTKARRLSSSAVLLRAGPCPFTTAAPPRGTISLENQRKVLSRCEELQGVLQGINDRVRGPLEKHSDKAPLLPFVFLLGNHSSGKSSFINFVLKRRVQTTGVAPTDDSFTIIAPGPSDIDQDGPALIGDPDMGFSGLRHFGPALIQHTQLKIRSGIAVNDFMMVDSPGMIDSPVQHSDDAHGMVKAGIGRHLDRGYDFQAVCKWFAERADVILLFYDPDKPGTTGETLTILTKSLTGMDHKLYIVLNKADQFRRIHDFARAYGSLCWNLSKVIPRKDLPRIYTMCLPVPHQTRLGAESNVPLTEADPFNKGLSDLERSREEVVSEVLKAPKRRIDNVITRLADSAHLVHMHAVVLESARADYTRQLWAHRLTIAGLGASGAALLSAGVYMGLDLQPVLGFGLFFGTGVTGFAWHNRSLLHKLEEDLTSTDGLNSIFRRLYARQLAEGDEFVTSLWKRVVGPLRLALQTQGLMKLSKVSKGEFQRMESIHTDEVPYLRRLASPVQVDGHAWSFSSNPHSPAPAHSAQSGSSPSSVIRSAAVVSPQADRKATA